MGNKLKKWVLWTMMPGILFSFSGCGIEEQTQEYDNSTFVFLREEADRELVFMETSPVIQYSLPELSPNIIVDRYGYEEDGDKEAYVKGKNIPEHFDVLDLKTGEVIYRGKTEEISYDKENRVYGAKLTFSDLEKGEYLIRCDELGESYPFLVGEKIYGKLFEQICAEIKTKCENDNGAVEELLQLLQVYEWHPKVFEDSDHNSVPDILDFTASWIQNNDFLAMDEESISTYAAFLAKFSYIYRQYDLTYATECLQMASTIYARTQNVRGKSSQDFFALTELFRATGLAAYGEEITKYEEIFQEGSETMREQGYLYGTMTYFVTKQKVNVELCDLFMQKLLLYGEEAYAECAKLDPAVLAKTEDALRILQDAECLISANYVLESMQYYRIMEDIAHFLLGRNRNSVFFLQDSEDTSKDYLMLLAQLVEKIEDYDTD